MSLRRRIERLERMQREYQRDLDAQAERTQAALFRLQDRADAGDSDAQRRVDAITALLNVARARMEREERAAREERAERTEP